MLGCPNNYYSESRSMHIRTHPLVWGLWYLTVRPAQVPNSTDNVQIVCIHLSHSNRTVQGNVLEMRGRSGNVSFPASHTVAGSHSHTTSDNEWKGVALQLVALNCYGIITQ